MAQAQTVLLIATDTRGRNMMAAGLAMYGYEVITANYTEAAELLGSKARLNVIVVDADLDATDVLGGIGQLAREVSRGIDVIYTSRMPHRLSPQRKVSGAPILREPFHPHQLASVIAHMRHRPSHAAA